MFNWPRMKKLKSAQTKLFFKTKSCRLDELWDILRWSKISSLDLGFRCRIKFRSKYSLNCTVVGLNFLKISGRVEGLTLFFSGFAFGLSLALSSRAHCTLNSSFALGSCNCWFQNPGSTPVSYNLLILILFFYLACPDFSLAFTRSQRSKAESTKARTNLVSHFKWIRLAWL